MIKMLINQPILLASLAVAVLLFLIAMIYLLVMLRRRRMPSVTPRPSRKASALQKTAAETVPAAPEAQPVEIKAPEPVEGEIPLPVLGKADSQASALAAEEKPTAQKSAGAGFTLFRRKKKAAPQKAAAKGENQQVAPTASATDLATASVSAAAEAGLSAHEEKTSSRLLGIEQEMLALKELYQDGQIARDVYVTETRALYKEAEGLVQA